MVFDIGNVLMDFRWKEYMRSLFGENEALIQTINQGIWHNGCWAAMTDGPRPCFWHSFGGIWSVVWRQQEKRSGERGKRRFCWD